jgi:hypothetical protein
MGERGESEGRSQEPEEKPGEETQGPGAKVQEPVDVREVVRAVMEEMGFAERGALEQRVNELVAENQRAREAAEASERSASIRAELQRLGVVKLDLAYRAVKDDVYRADDGRLMARGGMDLKSYLGQFVGENPELLPARLGGGSGAAHGSREVEGVDSSRIDLSRIRPGMNPEELDRVRQEVARVAARTLRGI